MSHNENPPAPSGRIFSEETHSASLLPNSTIFVIFHWMCFHSADEKKMKRVWEFLIMKYTFNQVHFNFYDIAAVWKQKEKAFDFCVLSFKRACTQALTIGRITRRMGAHLTAFVAIETLLKQLKFQGSALYSSTHTYTAVNEPWLSYKMVRSYYAIADVRRIPY